LFRNFFIPEVPLARLFPFYRVIVLPSYFLSSLNSRFEQVSCFKDAPEAAIICARIKVKLNTLYKTRNLIQLKKD
jgi:hypothetical protein